MGGEGKGGEALPMRGRERERGLLAERGVEGGEEEEEIKDSMLPALLLRLPTEVERVEAKEGADEVREENGEL